MDRGDARPTRWILYRRTYDPGRGRYVDLPFSGHKTERDARASQYFADVELRRLQGDDELVVDDEFYHLERVSPISTRELIRRNRTASRAFRHGADVLRVLELLDLPLGDSGFMIGPWPPGRRLPGDP